MKSFRWAGALAFGVVVAVLCIAERRRPLRRRVEPKPLQRAARNAVLGGTALAHRVPGLWRFHVVHHVDRELDTSTGVRFHFGEMTLTAALRAAQILVIGVDRRTLGLWQRLLTLSVLFHHSNLRLPIGLERALCLFIVTPRLHGVHHSERRDETDSNYASLLSIWDVLHGTRRVDIPQQAITIGIPGRRDAGELTTRALLAMPFRPQRRSWLEDEPSQPTASPPSPVIVTN